MQVVNTNSPLSPVLYFDDQSSSQQECQRAKQSHFPTTIATSKTGNIPQFFILPMLQLVFSRSEFDF